MPERISNEVFFASPEHARGVPAIPEEAFYAGHPRPPAEVSVAVRAAATPVRFAIAITIVGWGGILFQAGLLQQIVFGAPVFEELAKFGPPLLVALLLRARTLWVRMPLAWASGAGFGVMEHHVTYADESTYLYVGRIVFHALAPGLSMLVYAAIEGFGDVRAQYAATVPATLFHWANNFMAILLGFAGVLTRLPAETAGLAWATGITAGMAIMTLAALLAPRWWERLVQGTLEAAMPKLGLAPVRPLDEERRLEDIEPL